MINNTLAFSHDSNSIFWVLRSAWKAQTKVLYLYILRVSWECIVKATGLVMSQKIYKSYSEIMVICNWFTLFKKEQIIFDI